MLPPDSEFYFGQGALLVDDEKLVNHRSSYWPSPGMGRVPLVLLACGNGHRTSQAVIAGAFSVASAARIIRYLPRLRIARHVGVDHRGQICVPWINGVLPVCVLTLVFAFRSSAS